MSAFNQCYPKTPKVLFYREVTEQDVQYFNKNAYFYLHGIKQKDKFDMTCVDLASFGDNCLPEVGDFVVWDKETNTAQMIKKELFHKYFITHGE